MLPRRRQRRHKKTKLIIYIFLAIFLLLIGYVGYKAFMIISSAHKDMGTSSLRQFEVNPKEDPFSVLIAGIDLQDGVWRPDSLILLTLNPKTKTMKLVNIPRDTYCRIANTNEMTKINHSATAAIKRGLDPDKNVRETVQQLLDIPIDSYVRINFWGFIDLVDSLGGVDIDVKHPFSQKMLNSKTAHFHLGKMHVMGQEALAYVRMRYQDVSGDAGRNERQRQVLVNVFNELLTFNGFTKITALSDIVRDNVKHNVEISSIPQLMATYRLCRNNIEGFRIKTSGKKINGTWYEMLSEQERQRVSKLLQQHLEFMPKKHNMTNHWLRS